MIINDSKKIKTIQEEFQKKFPYLKIQFYSKPHDTNQGSAIREQLPEELTIGEARTVHNEGDFSINEQMTVAVFERDFAKKFGLNVQVFRKSGDIWMQTTSTDNWTLTEQNRKGGSSEKAFIEKYGS